MKCVEKLLHEKIDRSEMKRKSYSYVTILEKRHLPLTEHQDTLFTIKRQLHTLTNKSGRYICRKLSGMLLLQLVSEACQTSTSAQVSFKQLHIPLTNGEPGGCNSPQDWLISLAMDLVSRSQTFFHRVLINQTL